jgi:hypothetical protein
MNPGVEYADEIRVPNREANPGLVAKAFKRCGPVIDVILDDAPKPAGTVATEEHPRRRPGRQLVK